MHRRLLSELKRRNVWRAAALYMASAWLLVQVAAQLFPLFSIPTSVLRWIVVAAVFGLPFWIAFAWFYEWTPEGFRREQEFDSTEPEIRPASKMVDRWIIGILSTAVVLLLTNTIVRQNSSDPPKAAESRAGFPPHAVVVVPFENRTGDAALDPLGRWAADWVRQGLSRTRHLRVLDAAAGPPGSSPELHGGADLHTVLERIGAEMLVSGAYYLHGDSLQFHVGITDARGGTMIPTVEPVRGTLAQPQIAVHALGERVTGALAAHWDLRILALSADGSRPPSYEAYQAWVEGLELFARVDFRASRERLLHAASLDTSFASPLLWAAATYGNLRDYASADSLLQIVVRRRSRLLPFDRYHLAVLQAYYRGDHLAAYRASRSMLEVAPASEHALFLVGQCAININHPGEAVEVLRRINVERSEVDWDRYGTGLADAYHLLGRYENELDEARNARVRTPDAIRPYRNETRALIALGRTAEALSLLQRSVALPPQPGLTPALVARTIADEMLVHGHSDGARTALAAALAWYRNRPAAEQASVSHRDGFARTLYRAGHWDEAGTLFEDLSEQFSDNVDYLGHLGVIAARKGQKGEAERISQLLSQMSQPYLQGNHTRWRSRIATVLGQPEQAITLLQASLTQGQTHGLALHADADLLPLHRYASYQQLVQARR